MKPPSVARFHPSLTALALGLAISMATRAGGAASEVSEASTVPVALSVVLPVVLVGGVGSIVVTGVEASVDGTVWVVENVADGVKGSICFAGRVIGRAGVAAGTVIVVTAVAAGMVLSAAGHVVAFIPNEIGRTLSYNQRVSP